jgi:hypothetical protein
MRPSTATSAASKSSYSYSLLPSSAARDADPHDIELHDMSYEADGKGSPVLSDEKHRGEKRHVSHAVSTREVDTGAALIAGDDIELDEAESIRIRCASPYPWDDSFVVLICCLQEENRLAYPPPDVWYVRPICSRDFFVELRCKYSTGFSSWTKQLSVPLPSWAFAKPRISRPISIIGSYSSLPLQRTLHDVAYRLGTIFYLSYLVRASFPVLIIGCWS